MDRKRIKYLVHVTMYQNLVLRQINKCNLSHRMNVNCVVRREIADAVPHLIPNHKKNYLTGRKIGRKL